MVRSDRNRPLIIRWQPGYLAIPTFYVPFWKGERIEVEGLGSSDCRGLSVPAWHVTMTSLEASKLRHHPSQVCLVPCSRCDDPSRQSGPNRSSRTIGKHISIILVLAHVDYSAPDECIRNHPPMHVQNWSKCNTRSSIIASMPSTLSTYTVPTPTDLGSDLRWSC